MEELKQRILKDGVAKKEGGIVRVGSFLGIFFGTIIKLIGCGLMLVALIQAIG